MNKNRHDDDDDYDINSVVTHDDDELSWQKSFQLG